MGTSLWQDCFEFVELFLLAIIIAVLAVATAPIWLPVRAYRRWKFYQWNSRRKEKAE